MLVYFCSWQWSKWSVSFSCLFFVLATTYQIFFIVSELQYSVECISNILLLQFDLYIFVLDYSPNHLRFAPVYFILDNNLPDKIYCYGIRVKCFILIKLVVLSGTPVYFCSQQLSKHSITCDCTMLMSPNISILSYTFTVLKYL